MDIIPTKACCAAGQKARACHSQSQKHLLFKCQGLFLEPGLTMSETWSDLQCFYSDSLSVCRSGNADLQSEIYEVTEKALVLWIHNVKVKLKSSAHHVFVVLVEHEDGNIGHSLNLWVYWTLFHRYRRLTWRLIRTLQLEECRFFCEYKPESMTTFGLRWFVTHPNRPPSKNKLSGVVRECVEILMQDYNKGWHTHY